MATDPEAELVLACQRAEPRALEGEFRELYERYKDRVYNVCYRITGNPTDALDASQETFGIVFRRIREFRFQSRFSSWIYRIAVNASIDDSDPKKPAIVYKRYYNVGVAVSTKRGLMVPVLRNADQLSFFEVENGIGELAARGRDGKLTMDDFSGGTFTISNGGVFGSLMSTLEILGRRLLVQTFLTPDG